MPTPRKSAHGLVAPVASIEHTCRPMTITKNAFTIQRGIRHPSRTSRSQVCDSRSKALDWSAATTAAVLRIGPSTMLSVTLAHAPPAGPSTWFHRGPERTVGWLALSGAQVLEGLPDVAAAVPTTHSSLHVREAGLKSWRRFANQSRAEVPSHAAWEL